MSSESSQRRSILRIACLALPLAMACQMVSGDEVPRTPPLVRGSGGSAGRDVPATDEPLADVPAPPIVGDTLPLDQTTADYDGGAAPEACGRDASCDNAE